MRWVAAVAVVMATACWAASGDDDVSGEDRDAGSLRLYEVGCLERDCADGVCIAVVPGETLCSATCVAHDDCAPDGLCFDLGLGPRCLLECERGLDCVGSWVCEPAVNADTGAVEGRVCVPPGTAR